MNIRPETPGDYGAIADVHVEAFGRRIDEAVIVTLLRQRREFVPELSLVAEIEGRIVAHALFSPYSIQLLGNPVRAVNLAPLAVHPAYQKQGIGGSLIQEGHRIARAAGYSVSFLLGHPEYYPRFGYKTGVYGEASLIAAKTDPSLGNLLRRSLNPTDVPAVQRLWEAQEGAVDFALSPGSSLLDWVSPNPLIESIVYTLEDKVVGYARIHHHEPLKARIFLAASVEIARGMIADLAGTGTSLTLPLHPYSRTAALLGVAQSRPWKAGMACSLTSDSPFDQFYPMLSTGERLPGCVIWPVAFDLA